jgi:hypothetical protein
MHADRPSPPCRRNPGEPVIPRTPSFRPPLVVRVSVAGGVLLLAASLVAACSGARSAEGVVPASAAPTASAPASSTTADPAAPSGSQLPLESSSPGAASSPVPSVDSHGVPELEALLPTKIGGVQLKLYSLRGPDFYALGTTDTQGRLDTMLGALGKTVADLSVADAGDPSGQAILELGAFRVAGAQPAALLADWIAANEASSPGDIAVSSEVVDGRRLTKLVDRTRDVAATTRAYVKGDTIFLIGADDPALVSAALAQLPTP